MLDVAALERAGFEKQYTLEEWEELQKRTARRYERTGASAAQPGQGGGHVTIDFVLKRGDVQVVTEQNTQDQAPFGISTTVRYPQIAIIENVAEINSRTACDASDTALILRLADRLGQVRR